MQVLEVKFMTSSKVMQGISETIILLISAVGSAHFSSLWNPYRGTLFVSMFVCDS